MPGWWLKHLYSVTFEKGIVKSILNRAEKDSKGKPGRKATYTKVWEGHVTSSSMGEDKLRR